MISTSYLDNRLSFSKGHLENNETLEQCAIRETFEETGINIRLIKPLGICIHPDYYCNKLGEILFYLATSLSDTIDHTLKNDDSTIVSWMNYNDVLNADLIDDYGNFYREHFKEIADYIVNNDLNQTK